MQLIQAKNYYRGRQGVEPDLIVLHVMVTGETSRIAENMALQASGWNRQASWHVGVDSDSAVRSVKDSDTAFAAKGANQRGLHLEFAGMPNQTADEWRDTFSLAELARGAVVVRDWLQTHPHTRLRYLDRYALRSGQRGGITTHAEVEKAWPSTGHWDPGPNFPLMQFIGLVAAATHFPTVTQEALMVDMISARRCPVDGGLQKLQTDGGVINDGCGHYHGSYMEDSMAVHRNVPRQARAIVGIEGSTGYSLVFHDGAVYDFPA